MTTPEERRRNLTWGRTTLEEFVLDLELDAPWREAATALLAEYPSTDFLRQFNAAEPDELAPYASVLVAVRMLFMRVQASAACSHQRRYRLQVVLRHFP